MHTGLWSRRNHFMGPFLTLITSTPMWSVDPMKFVPWSDRNSLICLLIAINLLKALMNEDEVKSSITSICTARDVRQENIIAHRFPWAYPPRVRRVTICHGPNVSTQTFVINKILLRVIVIANSSYGFLSLEDNETSAEYRPLFRLYSFRNRINIPRRLLIRSAPKSSPSFKETSLNCADESKTILTWLRFLGW